MQKCQSDSNFKRGIIEIRNNQQRLFFLLLKWLQWGCASPWNKVWNFLFLTAHFVCTLRKINKACTKREREEQPGCCREDVWPRRGTPHCLSITRAKSRTNTASKHRKMWFRCLRMNWAAVSWVVWRPGSNLKEEARPFLTANTQSQTTAKIPQTFLHSMSSAALCFPLCAPCMWCCLLLHWLLESFPPLLGHPTGALVLIRTFCC